jgi:hypothetical protein
MSDFSNYAEHKVYDHCTGRAAWTMPTSLYLALFTAVTDAEAATGTEVAVSGYARVAVAFGPDTDGAGSNSGVIDVGPLQGSGTVTHAALMDASSAGNAITVIKALAASKAWTAGDTIRFAVGDIDFAIQ